jgi:TfoX/Sxy family transcriptional regulator of competence genes
MAYDEALAQRIRGLLNGPILEERKMFGGLAFLVGGRMCCGVQGTDLMVRVPKDEHARALREPHVRPMDFTGRSLKGFVYVSAPGTRSGAALRRWVALGRQVATQAAAETAGQSPRRRPSRSGRR